MAVFAKSRPLAAKKVIEYLGCPYEYIVGGKTPEDVMKRYRRAYERGRAEGFTPLLIAVSEVFRFASQRWISRQELTEGALSADRFDPQEWFESRISSDRELFSESEYDPNDGIMLSESRLAQMELRDVVKFGSEGTVDVILAKIPTANPWEVLAWLPFGGWGYCPNNAELVQIAEYWYKRYGAIPALYSFNALEFIAPCVSSEKAKELAREYYSFCPDAVHSYFGNIKTLRISLQRSNIWHFWWE